MEFNEKLQELRKQKGLTQEELAQLLYVSRTAISKWESGRGYPNIDSLKAIAKFFSITIDELLSGDELLTIAEADNRQKEMHLRDLVFGLLDCSITMVFFLPFFGQKQNEMILEVSLLSLTGIAPYLKAAYWAIVSCIAASGILTLALQNCAQAVWVRCKRKLSVLLNLIGTVLFVISQQPYAATFLLIILATKVLLLVERK